MFNLMDNQREGYEKMLTERDELNERWKIEKDNLKKTQKVYSTSSSLFFPSPSVIHPLTPPFLSSSVFNIHLLIHS